MSSVKPQGGPMKIWRATSSRATSMLAVSLITTIGVMSLSKGTASAQTRPALAGRTPDGKPNLNGIWQAMNSAHWDLEDHTAKPGPVVAMSALGAIPAGSGVIEGGEIP